MSSRERIQHATNIFVIGAISLLLIYYAQGLLIPLVLAIMAWSLLNTLSDHIMRIPLGPLRLPRWLSLLLAIVLLLSFLLLVYEILASQADALKAAAPVYQENFARLANQLMSRFGVVELPSSETFLAKINVGTIVGWLGGSVGSLLNALLMVLLYTGFLFSEQGVMMRKLEALASTPEGSHKLHEIFSEIARQVQSYIWMKTLVSMGTGLCSYLVMRWIGVDFAAVWALLIFLLNYIPNIGSFIAVLFPSMLALIQFDTLTPFFITVLGLGSVQITFGTLLEPALMGKSLNLSPLMIILSLTVWGMIWGIAGMFLSVPIMVMLTIVCARFESLRRVAVVLSADASIRGEEVRKTAQ